MMKKWWLLAFLASLAACAKKQVVQPVEETSSAQETPIAETEELPIKGTEFTDVSQLRSVSFEFDQADLTAGAREILAKNADFIKSRRGLEALVEGHCDERGTTEYNLGLGQRRAKTVRQYYIRLGVSSRQIGTISYGEEKPLCDESGDDCWERNRRAETKARQKQQ